MRLEAAAALIGGILIIRHMKARANSSAGAPPAAPTSATSTGDALPGHRVWNFKLRELETSGSRPDLVRRIPGPLVPSAVRLIVQVLQPARDFVRRALHVHSGYRSAQLNQAVGGSPTSQHMRAEAGDVSTGDFPTDRRLFLALLEGRVPGAGVGQVIIYPERRFLHLALPSPRYPNPSFHVHWPSRGLRYHQVRTREELQRLGLA